MFKTAMRQKFGLVFLIFLISAFLFTSLSYAATESKVTAEDGGKIKIARGVTFWIPPESLKTDTPIYADMWREKKFIVFEFGPDGTKFRRPAELRIQWQSIRDASNFVLYGEKGEQIKPEINIISYKRSAINIELVYKIEHFSIYYFRRR
ncbi:hypothetical protein GF312_16290 [Candidatus Poribacteria bacterium]|nr:hypothetical protein [Candidatus Poribacteria bacterium]